MMKITVAFLVVLVALASGGKISPVPEQDREDDCPNDYIKHKEKCYKVSSERLSWHEARFECLSLEGNYDLAIVDNNELFDNLKIYTNHWIGLYSRVGQRDFRWVDGTKLEFGKIKKQKPWGASEPSDMGAHEDCVHTMAGGLWNDYYCGARFNYICGPALQEWCQYISEYECDDEYVKMHCPETCSQFAELEETTMTTNTAIGNNSED